MKKSVWIPTLLLTLLISAFAFRSASAQEDGPVVYGISFLSGNRMMISINMPEPVESEYHALVGVYGYKRFECLVVDEYPQRLYCVGPMLPKNMLAHVQLFDNAGNQTVLDAVVTVPKEPKPPVKEKKEKKEQPIDPCESVFEVTNLPSNVMMTGATPDPCKGYAITVGA